MIVKHRPDVPPLLEDGREGGDTGRRGQRQKRRKINLERKRGKACSHTGAELRSRENSKCLSTKAGVPLKKGVSNLKLKGKS